MGAYMKEIVKLKEEEQELIVLKEELESKLQKINELTTTMNILLENVNGNKKKMENQVMSNIKELIYPLLNRLKNTCLNEKQK
jgi:hypothetical protein